LRRRRGCPSSSFELGDLLDEDCTMSTRWYGRIRRSASSVRGFGPMGKERDRRGANKRRSGKGMGTFEAGGPPKPHQTATEPTPGREARGDPARDRPGASDRRYRAARRRHGRDRGRLTGGADRGQSRGEGRAEARCRRPGRTFYRGPCQTFAPLATNQHQSSPKPGRNGDQIATNRRQREPTPLSVGLPLCPLREKEHGGTEAAPNRH